MTCEDDRGMNGGSGLQGSEKGIQLPVIRTSLQPTGDIFIPSVSRGVGETQEGNVGSIGLGLIPIETKRAGRLLQQSRMRHGVSPSDIASRLGIRASDIHTFEDEGSPMLDLRRTVRAATVFIDEADENMVELENIAQGQEWMRTFTHPYMTFGRSLTYMRLAEKMKKIDFARRAHVGVTSLSEYEAEVKPPQLSTLQRMIESSVLDPRSKAAQLLRLKRGGIDPMTSEKLKECTLGELIRYLRILNGANHEELGSALGYRQDSISRFELGVVKNPFVNHTLDLFIDWLNLPAESALTQAIRQKSQNYGITLSDEIIQDAVMDQYLFQEHLQTITAYILSPQDTSLLKQMEQQGMTFGETLKLTRERRGLSQSQFAGMTGYSRGHIEGGRNIPEDYAIARLLVPLEYDIHHPITHYLLNYTEKARAEKEHKERPW